MIPSTHPAPSTKPWPTLVALAALWTLTLADQGWVFALLFIGWALYDIATGESNFIQRITRQDHPATYWLVIASWIALSVLWIALPS